MLKTQATVHGSTTCLLRAQADATYLIVNDKMELENFGLNAVCTHLGCVVPWDTVCSASVLAELPDVRQTMLPFVLDSLCAIRAV